MIKPFILSIIALTLPSFACAEVKIYKDQHYRYIESDGIPDHATGRFPNAGNPNSISAQSHQYRIPLHPTKNHAPIEKRGVIGVALNGIPFEPGTAEFWENDRSLGWNYEALSGQINLGLDYNNAHVQPTGMYHYHGIPTSFVDTRLRQIGYAADGFPLFIAPARQYRSGYNLKPGNRPSGARGPGGRYDGTFTTDYEYVAGSGNLDICNGTYIHGQYTYIITKEFPHLPRCLFGKADPSFDRKTTPHNQNPREEHRRRRTPPIITDS